MKAQSRYLVLDLFAGPGGLGEGFSSCTLNGERPFNIALSVEMDRQAHATLQLRSFYRQFELRHVPELYYEHLRGRVSLDELTNYFPNEWSEAQGEALCARLGDEGVGDKEIGRRVRRVKKRTNSDGRHLIIIGGPPCQAYSLVGRARNRGIADYVPEQDHRHRLYVEYLKIIKASWPAAFVMENVKGILSSKLDSELIFPTILDDLRSPNSALGNKTRGPKQRYRLLPIVVEEDSGLFSGDDPQPSSFIVRCENFGVPQRRHRVFILGLREDLGIEFDQLSTSANESVTVRDVLADMPALLSGISTRERCSDWPAVFRKIRSNGYSSQIENKGGPEVSSIIKDAAGRLEEAVQERGAEFVPSKSKGKIRHPELSEWIRDPRLGGHCNHTTRSHMGSDLLRYLYAASYSLEHGISPTLAEFPKKLMPEHRNAAEAARERALFADRFRVQVWDQPSTTVTSHISKDGHYFIHPDPSQCRSLTVREAARLQTFPDNYFFCGPRTSQFTQVGNAVPPFMARQIAERLAESLVRAKV